MSNSDLQAVELNIFLFDDDFLAFGDSSNDLFANSCNDNTLRIRDALSACKNVSLDDIDSSLNNLDLFQKLGQGELFKNFLTKITGSQEGSEPLENDVEKQTLPAPSDIDCDPVFPFRLCCNGRLYPAVYPSLSYEKVNTCYRCKYSALFSWVFSSSFERSVHFSSQPFLPESIHSTNHII